MNSENINESSIEVLGKQIDVKVNYYINRYYLKNNDIFITDYVDNYGNIQYQKVDVKEGKPIFLYEKKVKGNVDVNM